MKGRKQIILSPEGYLFPVQIRSGLPYIPIRPAEEDDLKNLSSVVMTSPMEWDPKVLDSEINLEQDNWYDSNNVNTSRYFDYLFNKTGLYRHCEI